jgi:translation initiation factor RLI1
VERRASSVAFAPERLSSTLRMSADVYLRHVARLRGLDQSESRRRIAHLCDRFALEPGRDAQIRTLSKGNSQKVAIIQVLLSPVDLLVLDEPHTGLDVSSRVMLDEMLTERAKAGAAVVLTTHRNDAFGTRRLDLLAGRLTAHDCPPARPAPQTVRIGLASTPDSVSLAFADMPGVRAVTAVTPNGLTVIADRTISDVLLAEALLARWSVTSVLPIEVE